MSRKIHIFDTTLRDGEQVPGAKLNKRQKIEIAQQLAKLNVDVIEGGFPCSSPGDLQAVRAISQQVKGPVIAALARAVKEDIDIAWEAVREAEQPRIHVFLGSSDIHIQKEASAATAKAPWRWPSRRSNMQRACAMRLNSRPKTAPGRISISCAA